ncbi:MAG: hypothetical protein OEY95_05305 [Candidatus Bathyarchaeota archaeon]|nr:hypothetical protein [Candidatus Bathyarchaeota archaeon]
MDIKLLYEMARSLYKETSRAAEAKEYVSYYVFQSRYNQLYAQVCTEMGVPSLPIGQPVQYKGPYDTLSMSWSGYLNDIIVEIGQLLAYLENYLGVPIKVTSKLVEDIDDKLRAIIRKKPEDEREVQDAIENLLIAKDYEFNREKVSIPYSAKYYVPDFTFDALNTALDAKLCNSQSDERKIIDEINADIPAYKSKYLYVVFVVYDTGFIRDTLVFVKGIEKSNPNVYVTVVKH